MQKLTPEEEILRQSILERGNIPQHIAIIMDGNGRWAKSKNLKRIDGHVEGINSVRAVVEASGDVGIKAVTFYTFSTENWRRPPKEVSALWRLLIKTVKNEVPELNKNNVKLMVSGLIDKLPLMTRRSVLFAIDALKDNTGLIVNLALNYSSRQELTIAVQKIAQLVHEGKLNVQSINEETISQNLFTHELPDPDLVIRTSGEFRISNFLLWQIAYSELYVTDTFWPDFRKKQFFEAIISYQNRERRFGLVSEQVRK